MWKPCCFDCQKTRIEEASTQIKASSLKRLCHEGLPIWMCERRGRIRLDTSRQSGGKGGLLTGDYHWSLRARKIDAQTCLARY